MGSDGWIRYVRISGKELNGHYRTIGNSMEVFGMQVDNISHKGDYVECIINQTIFGRWIKKKMYKCSTRLNTNMKG